MLTPEGRRILEEIAQRHGVSLDAVTTLLRALAQSGGYQAQFNHPDLGGMGQWSRGGMIMIGDMFNQGLKHRVDEVCNALAELVRGQRSSGAGDALFQSQSQDRHGDVSLFVAGSGPSDRWWPEEFGSPASAGAQNDLRYAFFPGPRRLAIQRAGSVSIYDTGPHQIAGVSQQQGGDQSVAFTSQFGLVRVADLPMIAPGNAAPGTSAPASAVVSSQMPSVAAAARAAALADATTAAAPRPAHAAEEIFVIIERLAELHQKGIMTEEEFVAKKTELLSRL